MTRLRESDLHHQVAVVVVTTPSDYADSFEDLLCDAGYSDPEFIYPPKDYNHSDVVWLSCMQKTFSRLYHEKYDPKPEAV